MNLFDEEIKNFAEIENTRTLRKVTIQNYRNISYKEYVLNGKSLLLKGKNGLGKTNVLEAIFWALSGVLFNGVSLTERQEIKPINSEIDVVTSVKLEYDYNSFSFERRIEQKWSKDGLTYKGTETTLLVNGAASKDQDTAINSLLSFLGMETIQNRFSKIPSLSKTSIFELIYNSNSLRTLDYKEIRAMVTDMVGEVDFKEIINSNQQKYTPLVKPLREHGMDLQALKTDTRSKLFDKKIGLEKQAIDLEAAIKSFDEEGKKIVNSEDVKTANDNLTSIEKEIAQLESEKQTPLSDLISKADNEITEKKLKIYERETVLRREHEQKIKTLQENPLEAELKSKQESLNDLKNGRIALSETISTKSNEKSRLESSISSKRSELETLQAKRQALIAEYKKLKNPESKEMLTCPKCNEIFDLSETKEFKEKLQPKIEEVSKNGKETTQKIVGVNEGIDSLQVDIGVIDSVISDLQSKREQIDKNVGNLQTEVLSLSSKVQQEKAKLPILDLLNDSIIISIKDEIKAVQNAKESILTNDTEHKQSINVKISELREKKKPYLDTINAEATARSYQRNADTKRKELAAVNLEIQSQTDIEILIKELEKEMYQTLDSKVANVFGDNVKFKLWKLNVSNGEYDTRLCEIYIKDIEGRFAHIKNGINTGMFPVRATEIIERIKAFYKIPKSFVFVDELGSLDHEHVEMIKAFGEQVFATQVGENKPINEIVF